MRQLGMHMNSVRTHSTHFGVEHRFEISVMGQWAIPFKIHTTPVEDLA